MRNLDGICRSDVQACSMSGAMLSCSTSQCMLLTGKCYSLDYRQHQTEGALSLVTEASEQVAN